MKMSVSLLSLMMSIYFLSGCATSRQFSEGQYDDPNEVRLLDDKFNEADVQQMAETMVSSLLTSPVLGENKRPVVQVETVKNQTDEHVDTVMITDKIRTQLIKSGKIRFSNKEERGTLKDETEYQAENTRKDTTKKAGQQIGADFILSGRLTSNVQEVGNRKLIYYKFTLNLTSITSNIIEWSDEKEVRKAFKKKSVTL